jgi:hypothetical protein
MPENRITALLGLAICLAAAGVRAGDNAAKVDNPLYKGWSKYKVGSSVTYKAEAPGPDGKIAVVTVTSTLTRLTDDGAEIDAAASVDGKPPTHKTRTIPAKVDVDVVKSGGENEDVEAMGKMIKCKKYELPQSADGGADEEKFQYWISDDVVGGLVKMAVPAARRGGKETTVTVQSSQAK